MQPVNWKATFGKIILEMFAIMFGVYLGLLATQWNEHRKDLQEKEQSRLNLIEEMQANRMRLSKVIDYHEMLRDSSWYYYNNPSSVKERPTFFKGLQISSLPDGAYQTAILSESINLFSQKSIRNLSNLYTFQRDYNEFAKLALSGLITQDMMREDNMMQLARYIGITMTDIINMERSLMKSYEEMEKKLQATK